MAKKMIVAIKLISVFGFVFMCILSIMCYVDVEALKIKKGKNKNSGTMCIVTALVRKIYS